MKIEKTCSKCSATKSASEFPTDKKAKDGLGSWCRECQNTQQRERRRVVRRDTELGPANRAKNRARRKGKVYPSDLNRTRIYRSKEARIAQHCLARAVKIGKVTRPTQCENCGDSPTPTKGRSLIQGHHDDYSKPLDVRWLCTLCHAEVHREDRYATAER